MGAQALLARQQEARALECSLAAPAEAPHVAQRRDRRNALGPVGGVAAAQGIALRASERSSRQRRAPPGAARRRARLLACTRASCPSATTCAAPSAARSRCAPRASTSRDGEPVDQDAVALARRQRRLALTRPGILPRGEQGRRDYRLAPPLVEDSAVSGTTAGGLASAIEQLSGGRLVAIPYSGPWTRGDARRPVRSRVAALRAPGHARREPRHAPPVGRAAHGADAAARLPVRRRATTARRPTGTSGTSCASSAACAARAGSLYAVADTYPSLGSRGVHLQPGERLAAALERPRHARGRPDRRRRRARTPRPCAPAPPRLGLREEPVGQRHASPRQPRGERRRSSSTLVCCDLGAIVRGRSLPRAELGEQLARRASAGCRPTSRSRRSARSPSPTRSARPATCACCPTPTTRVRVERRRRRRPPLELVLCDIVETDGQPWECCPRHFLRERAAELDDELGVRVLRELRARVPARARRRPRRCRSRSEAQRRAEPFAARRHGRAARRRGVRARALLRRVRRAPVRDPRRSRRRGSRAPTAASCSRRSCARSRAGTSMRASFAPLLDPAEAGNGVHIHSQPARRRRAPRCCMTPRGRPA